LTSGFKKEGSASIEEARRIRIAYAERDRTLAGTMKRDPANQANEWRTREHRERLAQILRERLEKPLTECRILDVGCGYGSLLAWFRELGVPAENLFGVDLLANRIQVARETNPTLTFLEGNAERLDFSDGSFDLVAAFTVFSSILDPAMAKNVARSMSRVLNGGGAVVWYDMRYPNPWNRHLKAMTKGRIRELFPSAVNELESTTVLPPLARRLGRATDRAYPLLASIPALRTHYIGLLWPDGCGGVASKTPMITERRSLSASKR
jgi:ubiquinone/menaquinone biosynthesis C-methylase UbiE